MKNSTQETSAPNRSNPKAVKTAPPTDARASFKAATSPTSVALSQHERDALKALAKALHMTPSALMRLAIQQKLAQGQAGPGASIQSSSVGGAGHSAMLPMVVDLANALTSLGYVVCQLETRLTRLRRVHARDLLSQAVLDLQALARRLGC